MPSLSDKPTKFVHWRRVSTQKQGFSGLGLGDQDKIVSDHVLRCGGNLIGVYTEVESGKKANNSITLANALAFSKVNNATLIVAKLDRLARDVHFISGLMNSDIEFVACDMPHANRLMLHIMAAFAEHEGLCISQRTKAALAIAKARGTKLGAANPNYWTQATKASLAERNNLKHYQHETIDSEPILRLRQVLNSGVIWPRNISRILNRKKYQTYNGTPWNTKLVIRAIRRHNLLPIEKIRQLSRDYLKSIKTNSND